MNNIATIETIHSIKNHPNADALDIGMVRGFGVVIKKDQFKNGEQIVFVWPDTITEPAEWNAFLDKDKKGKPIKIKSCKIRGQFSTGLVIPIDILKQYDHSFSPFNYFNGDDVSIPLGVKKYIKDDGSANKNNGESKGSFPSGFISKTDEILAQSEPEVYDEFLNEEVYVSLKIDGQSLTFIRDGEDIHVCSRNLSLKDGDNRFWNTVRKYNLIEKTEGVNIAIQGEQYGIGIQKNPLAINEIKFAIFTIKDLQSGEYYSLDEMIRFCENYKLPLVPILDRHNEVKSFEYYQEFADNQRYEGNNMAEGIVLRTTIPKYSSRLGRMLSVKFINRNYKD